MKNWPLNPVGGAANGLDLSEKKDRGLAPVSEVASAYTKGRARLPVELINHLSDRVRKKAHNMTPDEWKWKGLKVYLVGGFVLRAPDTLANQKKYPQPSSQKEGLGFPQVRVVTTTSLAGGCEVHHNTAPVEGKKTGEVSLFHEKHKDFEKGDIVVADSNFESFHDAALLIRRGVHMVCCICGTRNSPFEGDCDTIDDVAWLIHSTAFHLVGNRPGRNEPRAIKRGNTKYPKLKEPRPRNYTTKS